MKNLVRRYKISRAINEPLDDNDKEIINFIKSKIDGLTIYQVNDYEINFMNSEGECMLQQDSKNDILWVSYYDIWSVLEDEYLLNYKDIQIVIKGMVELAFKMSVSTPKQDDIIRYIHG